MADNRGAWHGDQAVKDKAVARVNAFAGALPDDYWPDCRPGRALGTDAASMTHERQHARIERGYGIPAEVVGLVCAVAGGLGERRGVLLAREAFEAIPVGADLSLVPVRLSGWLLEDLLFGLRRFEGESTVAEQAAVEAVLELNSQRLAGGALGSDRVAQVVGGCERLPKSTPAIENVCAVAQCVGLGDHVEALRCAEAAIASAMARHTYWSWVADALLECLANPQPATAAR